MNIFKNKKRSGFTLMEVAIAVMIVGLLITICIPIVQRQLAKSDEYAYYMAYRSVEKLGGQIVALGDPDPTNIYNKTSNSNNIKLAFEKPSIMQNLKNKIVITFTTLGNKFAYTENYLFKNLFPKSLADSDWTPTGTVLEDSAYYYVNLAYRVCKLGESIQYPEPTGQDEDGNPTYRNYSCTEDFRGAFGESGNEMIIGSLVPEQYCLLGLDNDAKTAKKRELENFVKADKSAPSDLNIKAYCEKLANYCGGEKDGIEYRIEPPEELAGAALAEDETEDDEDSSVSYGCAFSMRVTGSGVSSGSADSVHLERPTVTNTCTPAYGFYGMYNAGGDYALSCECTLGKLPTQNNDKVCCPQLTGLNSYSRSDISSGHSEGTYCVNCEGDFNSVGNWCCPKHSVFNGTACQCVEGYEMDAAAGTKDERCVKTKCAPGSHLDRETEVCVPNPPLLKADRFCHLIKDNWNTVSNKCDTFATVNNAQVYNDVLEAAKSASGNYLSIQSRTGSFRAVTPNIVLSNGLKLWILGDKAASISGLSYNPMNISSTQNMCQELLNSSNEPLSTKEKCDARGGYFCKGEAHCYTLDSASLDKMGDARNCCAAADISDLTYGSAEDAEKDNRAFAVSGFTVFVDINGDKGSGTLWEDVFPFYVGANGKVYPGYPLDADKAKDSTSEALYLGGNSTKNLPVDVYYYENDTRNDNARKKVIVFSNVSYARGLCFGKIINAHTPYCQNLGLKAKGGGTQVDKIKYAIDSSSNPCKSNNCFISVRNKLRFF